MGVEGSDMDRKSRVKKRFQGVFASTTAEAKIPISGDKITSPHFEGGTWLRWHAGTTKGRRPKPRGPTALASSVLLLAKRSRAGLHLDPQRCFRGGSLTCARLARVKEYIAADPARA
jgi:hypothetical protein